MKHKALYRLWMAFILMTLGSGIMRSQEPSLLVEEGRTWWYHYWYREADDMSFEQYREDFGLSLSGSEIYDGKEWQKCVVVNKDGSIMVDFPIAFLRQEDGKVYVLPRNTPHTEWESIQRLPARFGEVYGRFLCFAIGEESSNLEEYLLYDREMQPGDILVYPWIMDYPTIDKTVTIISDKMEDGRMEWCGKWGWDDVCLLVEGLGGVATSEYQCGAFVYPCMYRQVTTGIMGDPSELYLDKVTDKAGDPIWSSTSGVETVETEMSTSYADETIYDLHGRRVANPQRGAIYIRGGHKFVGR